MYLIFDTETTGFANFALSPQAPTQPNLVQLAALLVTPNQEVVAELGCIVRPQNWTIPEGAAKVHGISTERALAEGLPAPTVFALFEAMAAHATAYVCHNIRFDMTVMETFAHRCGGKSPFKAATRQICTMQESTDVCKLPGRYSGTYKWPKLQELHKFLFKEEFDKAHSATADVKATSRCLFQLAHLGHINLPAAKLRTTMATPESVPTKPEVTSLVEATL